MEKTPRRQMQILLIVMFLILLVYAFAAFILPAIAHDGSGPRIDLRQITEAKYARPAVVQVGAVYSEGAYLGMGVTLLPFCGIRQCVYHDDIVSSVNIDIITCVETPTGFHDYWVRTGTVSAIENISLSGQTLDEFYEISKILTEGQLGGLVTIGVRDPRPQQNQTRISEYNIFVSLEKVPRFSHDCAYEER